MRSEMPRLVADWINSHPLRFSAVATARWFASSKHTSRTSWTAVAVERMVSTATSAARVAG